MKKMILLAASVLVFTQISQAKEATSANAQAVNEACSADSSTAQCDGEKVGTGLLKCLHAYKKATPGYKFSEPCKTAMKTMREERKAAKENH